MDLVWMHRTVTYDGDSYERNYLVDTVSERVFGYVDAPSHNELCFMAVPHGMDDRFYLGLDAARGYLEACAVQIRNNEAAAEMGGRLLEESTPKPLLEEASAVNSVVSTGQ